MCDRVKYLGSIVEAKGGIDSIGGGREDCQSE